MCPVQNVTHVSGRSRAQQSLAPRGLPRKAKNYALLAEKLLTSQTPGQAKIGLSAPVFSKAPDFARTVRNIKALIERAYLPWEIRTFRTSLGWATESGSKPWR